MKLIFCPVCSDIVRLIRKKRTCECGASWGHYEEDLLHSVIGGRAVPLGLVNSEFHMALYDRPKEGLGSRFTAFVIPEKCDTVREEGGESAPG